MLERLSSQLAGLREADQLRDLTISSGIPLSSNDYLGLSTHPRLKEAIARAAAEDARIASTGSRLLSGNHERWEQLETEFAAFAGTDASLYFATGYQANIGLLSSILKPEDTVFSDAANHASLIDGIRLSHANKIIFPHLDLNYLEDALRRITGSGEKVIVVESIFSMDGDRAPIDELIGICERSGAFLIIDEAHSTGVEGVEGRGLVQKTGRHECILATIHTCGKALASLGAFVAGSQTLREFLINHARPFIFSTALPPYCAAHVGEALSLARNAAAERTRLKQVAEHLRQQLSAAGFDSGASSSQIVPLILGPNHAALRFAAALTEAGFAVRAIRPPTVPQGSARLRFSLNASIRIDDIDALVSVLGNVRDAEVVTE